MRMQTDCFNSEGLYKELNSFAAFDGVGEEDGFAAWGQILEVIDDARDSFVLVLSEGDYFFES